MSAKLNVCSDKAGWIGYVVLNGRAVILCRADFNGLDDLRYYADREGYDGILIGSPSVPFATIKTL